jgi:hypothetical protein
MRVSESVGRIPGWGLLDEVERRQWVIPVDASPETAS